MPTPSGSRPPSGPAPPPRAAPGRRGFPPPLSPPPGPLTLVVPRRPDFPISDLALAGLDTVALRKPAHPVAQALLREFGGPIVAPSANRSGHVSPTEAEHVLVDLEGRVDLVLDGGP